MQNCAECGDKWTIGKALEVVGGLSSPSKMPCYGYSIPANRCPLGSKLRLVEGSICSKCYALKGRYVFPNVVAALERRFSSLSNPDWVAAMVYLIRTRKMEFFRWHDAGDIQSVSHLQAIASVARQTPACKHWLPTREFKTVSDYLSANSKPENLTVRLSALMFDGPAPERMARRLGLVCSGANSKGKVSTCPAPKQQGECRDCRACWDKDVFMVSYKQH